MDEQTIRQKLRRYITRELIRDPRYDLGDDDGVITGGLMDSFALAELAVYIENEFNVYIPDPDLTVAKMDTLNQIVGRILKG
jgi:acyl carrier protein